MHTAETNNRRGWQTKLTNNSGLAIVAVKSKKRLFWNGPMESVAVRSKLMGMKESTVISEW